MKIGEDTGVLVGRDLASVIQFDGFDALLMCCQAPKMFRVKLSSNCTSYFVAEILLLKLSSHTIRYNLLA